MTRRVIHHGEAVLTDHPGNAGRQKGLAQARVAEQQQVLCTGTEVPGKPAADLQIPLRRLPGRARQTVSVGGVPAQLEGIKALRADIQQVGQLGDLLPGVVAAQTGAHGPVGPEACVAAPGAPGLFLQIVGRIAHSLQKLPPAALEGQILIPDGVDGGNGILPLPQSPGDDLAHGAAQAAVDIRQLRLPAKQTLLPLPELLGPALLVLIKAGHGPTENFTVIGHRVPSFTTSYTFPCGNRFYPASGPEARRTFWRRPAGPPPAYASRFRASGGGSH